MGVCLVGVGGDENLEAGEHFFCKLYGDLVSRFGSNIFRGREGLREVIEHSAVGLSVLQLGIHKFLVSGFGKTVDTRYKFPAFVYGFALPLSVLSRNNGRKRGIFALRKSLSA